MLSKGKRPYEPEVLEPRQRLRRNVQDLFANNALSGNRLLELARDVNRVDSNCFSNEARGAAAPGNVKVNAHRKLRSGFLKKSTWMPPYWAQVRCWSPKKGRLQEEWLAISLPHEIVAVLLRQGVADVLLNKEGMDPLTRQHLEACEAEALCTLLGISIWADGTPCNWDRTETIETLALHLPGLTGELRNMRIPITALGGKHCTKETMVDVCRIIKWSLMILATGAWPICRHDGAPWRKSDACRVKARPFLKGALVEVLADWDWMVKVYGLPAHNLLVGNCWQCNMTPARVWGLLYAGFTPVGPTSTKTLKGRRFLQVHLLREHTHFCVAHHTTCTLLASAEPALVG